MHIPIAGWRSRIRLVLNRHRHKGVEFGFQLPVASTAPDAGHPDIPLPQRLHDRPGPLIAVVIHVFYPELLPALLMELGHLEEPFDLYLTNASGQGLVIGDLPAAAQSCHHFAVRNLGRDVFPFVQLITADRLSSYELVLKLHTKRSAWRDEYDRKGKLGVVSDTLDGGGDAWRHALVQGLLGDDRNVSAITQTFRDDPRLGLVTAPGNVLGPNFLGYNAELVASLCLRAGIRPDLSRLRFAAGSMFWCRVSTAQLLARLSLSAGDFSPETGQTDGTTAHAVERVYGLLVMDAGMQLAESTTPDPPCRIRHSLTFC